MFRVFYDRRTHRVRDRDAGDVRIYLDFEYRRVECPACGVRRERLTWLSDTHRHTQRFARFIGRECRDSALLPVARRHHLSWGQVRRLDEAYMEDLLARHPPPKRVRTVGFDEISVRKGHTYVIVAADVERRRPIWMSDRPGRAEQDADRFYNALGRRGRRGLRLAVMDMWKPFRASTMKHAPQARIVFDAFHILGHLGKAMDQVRRREYRRANEKERTFIKGQRYTLLSHRANLNTKGRRSLALLLRANKRLHRAYLLKETFGQLWDFHDPVEARAFFDNWKAQLMGQGLEPFEKFAAMIERHWEGIVSYCDRENNKVSLGFMEGLNNKIRTLQRRAFGIKDLRYLKLKVLTSYIPDP